MGKKAGREGGICMSFYNKELEDLFSMIYTFIHNFHTVNPQVIHNFSLMVCQNDMSIGF